MDFVKSFTGGDNNEGQQQAREQDQDSNQQQNTGNTGKGAGFFDGIGDKLNSAAGGGKESEKNEDMLDKGTIFPSLHVALVLGSLAGLVVDHWISIADF